MDNSGDGVEGLRHTFPLNIYRAWKWRGVRVEEATVRGQSLEPRKAVTAPTAVPIFIANEWKRRAGWWGRQGRSLEILSVPSQIRDRCLHVRGCPRRLCREVCNRYFCVCFLPASETFFTRRNGISCRQLSGRLCRRLFKRLMIS